MATPVSPPPHRASFFGPYCRLLGVRSSGWSARFEECMIVSTEALGLEEDLSVVEASVADLITAKEAGDMAGSCRTWDFGPSLMTKDMIEELRQLGCFGDAKVKPLEGETIPKSKAANAVVFRDFFLCGLRFPAACFVRQVLEAFEVQLHHLTPNGIVTLSKFYWAYLSYGVEPNISTFYEYYEL